MVAGLCIKLKSTNTHQKSPCCMIHLPFDHVHQQHALPHTKGAVPSPPPPGLCVTFGQWNRCHTLHDPGKKRATKFLKKTSSSTSKAGSPVLAQLLTDLCLTCSQRLLLIDFLLPFSILNYYNH